MLILAKPLGPACHLGTRTCWGERPPQPAAAKLAFLHSLEQIIRQRISERPPGSYTVTLFDQGARRMAQKVGEEGLELALASDRVRAAFDGRKPSKVVYVPDRLINLVP